MKYEIITEGEHKGRIRALRGINGMVYIKKGEMGGFVDGYHNLSQNGNCWVGYLAQVQDYAHIGGDAYAGGRKVYGGYMILLDGYWFKRNHIGYGILTWPGEND